MSDPSSLKVWAPGVAALAVLLSTCEGPLSDAASKANASRDAEYAEQLLPGTWLREYSAQGVTARRVLTLGTDRAFREQVRVIDRAGSVTKHLHQGTWLYDGTNLKRKYTLVDGESPSRLNAPFATFQIRFESRNEFLGVDHVHGNRVLYRRVAPDTQP